VKADNEQLDRVVIDIDSRVNTPIGQVLDVFKRWLILHDTIRSMRCSAPLPLICCRATRCGLV
jgi:hypothetical protein